MGKKPEVSTSWNEREAVGTRGPIEGSMIAVSTSVIVAVVVVFLFAQRVREGVNARGGCPECRTPVPQFRSPTSFRQAIYGGWTCEHCGTEMNMRGARR